MSTKTETEIQDVIQKAVDELQKICVQYNVMLIGYDNSRGQYGEVLVIPLDIENVDEYNITNMECYGKETVWVSGDNQTLDKYACAYTHIGKKESSNV